VSGDDTVARHGVRFRFNFLAGTSYEDHEGTVWTYGEEPWWEEADLSADQRAEIDGWVAEHLAARPQDPEMLARWGTLEHNGVRHTHRKGAPIFDRRPAYGYRCAMCDAYVVNPNPGDFLFRGGPVDGQWLVTDGGPVWRVPVIPKITAMFSGSSLDEDMTINVVDYYRQGDRYLAR
jgi:hypothetical protein